MLIDTLLGAQDTEGTKLIVENPFAQGGLNDVGAIEAVFEFIPALPMSESAERTEEKQRDEPVHAVSSDDRGLSDLRTGG